MLIKKLKSYFNRQLSGESGNVFRGMITIAVGAGMARIIGLASIPILTRIYSPEDYGVLAIYTSIVAILVPILTLRYVTAIPLPKTDAMAFNIFILCAKLILIGTLLLSLVVGFFGESILGWFSMKELSHLWWLIVIGVLGTATYELLSLWATRKKNYKIIAKTQFTQSLTGNAVKISLGFLSLKPLGLVLGQLIAQSGGIGSLFRNFYEDFKKLYPSLSPTKQWFLAKYYQDFPWFRLPSQFLMVLSAQAPILMMSALYDKESTGQLGLAIMALSMPVNLIGGAMGKAYYAEIASIGRTNPVRIWQVTVDVQKKLFIIGFPASICLLFFAKPLFQLVFGNEWHTAGYYASILAFYTLLQFTSNPLVQVLNVIGSQLLFLLINTTRIIGCIFIYFLSLRLINNPEDFVILLSSYLTIYYLMMTFLIISMVHKAKKQG